MEDVCACSTTSGSVSVGPNADAIDTEGVRMDKRADDASVLAERTRPHDPVYSGLPVISRHTLAVKQLNFLSL